MLYIGRSVDKIEQQTALVQGGFYFLTRDDEDEKNQGTMPVAQQRKNAGEGAIERTGYTGTDGARFI